MQDSQGFHKVTLLVGIWVDIEFLTPVTLHVEGKVAATSGMKLDPASLRTGGNRKKLAPRTTHAQFEGDKMYENSIHFGQQFTQFRTDF